MLILEIAILLCPLLLILGIGGATVKALLHIPGINRRFTSLFRSLPLGRKEVQSLNQKERSNSNV